MGEFQSAVCKRESSSAKCSAGDGGQYYKFPTNRFNASAGDDQSSERQVYCSYDQCGGQCSHRGYYQKSAWPTRPLTSLLILREDRHQRATTSNKRRSADAAKESLSESRSRNRSWSLSPRDLRLCSHCKPAPIRPGHCRDHAPTAS